MKWAVKVVWHDGDEEFLKEGLRPAVFTSRSRAQEQADFMKIGMEEGECQSINVVQYPKSLPSVYASIKKRPHPRRWTDQDLYDAYLLGCEDEYHEWLPEPLDRKQFLANFASTIPEEQPSAHQLSAGEFLERHGLSDLSLHWPLNKPIPQIDYASGEAKPTLIDLMQEFAEAALARAEQCGLKRCTDCGEIASVGGSVEHGKACTKGDTAVEVPRGEDNEHDSRAVTSKTKSSDS